MHNISATIITFNESENIKDCIESLRSVCEDIVVLDSNSNDDTVEIAKKLGANVHYQAYLGDGPQKAKSAEFAKNDWVLSIDADERLDTDAIKAIQKLNLSDKHTGYAFCRKNFVGKRQIKAAGFYPDRVIRLYNRQYHGYSQSLGHATIDVKKVIKLDAHILHFTYKDYAAWAAQINQLSSRDAWANSSKKINHWTPVTRTICALIKKLVLRGGMFSRDGWIVAFTTAFKTLFKYLKIEEEQRKR